MDKSNKDFVERAATSFRVVAVEGGGEDWRGRGNKLLNFLVGYHISVFKPFVELSWLFLQIGALFAECIIFLLSGGGTEKRTSTMFSPF